MKKIIGVLLLSLTLLGSAHFAFAASDDEKVLMQLQVLEKQVQLLQARIKSKMMEGKTMPGGKMKEAMKMIDMAEDYLNKYYRLTDSP